LDFPGIVLVGLVPLGVTVVVLLVVSLGEVLDVLEDDALPVVLVELVDGDVPPALLEALLLVVGAVDVALPLLASGSHGTLFGFVLGTGVAVCAGGIAVWGVGEAVWACGVVVWGVGDAVCAGGVAVWGVGDAVCAPTDIAIPQSTRSKQVNTLILSFIRGLLNIDNASFNSRLVSTGSSYGWYPVEAVDHGR
jgi:hypothetical protein